MNLVKIQSINIWDEEWENGCFNTTTGANEVSSRQIRSKNLIPIKPSTLYRFNEGMLYPWVIFYDSSNQVIPVPNIGVTPADRSGNSVNISSQNDFTSPTNAYYMKFYMVEGYGATYKNDIQLCLGSESQKTTYHPHWVLGLDGQGKAFTADISSMLPSGIGCFVMGNTWRMRSAGVFMTDNAPSDAEVSGDTAGADCICNKYRREDAGYLIGANRSGICLRPSYWEKSEILVCDSNFSDATSFGNYINGTVLIYKKATT